jgi:cyanophycinase-like exopeptidase
MVKMPGRIALVGSGEYLPAMQSFERELISRGPSKRYVQIPTAAGKESSDRLDYWQRLGLEQSQRIDAEQVFLPIFNREDAMRSDLAKLIDGAGLIYISGGDPHYLAKTLRGTPVWEAIERNWRDGSSLAGCSAGAMALGGDVPNFRKMKSEGEPGFGLVPHIRTIPHYNKFFKWIPDAAAELFLKAPDGVFVVGIDELTAMWSDDCTTWNVVGEESVHILNSSANGKFPHGSVITI